MSEKNSPAFLKDFPYLNVAIDVANVVLILRLTKDHKLAAKGSKMRASCIKTYLSNPLSQKSQWFRRIPAPLLASLL